MLPHRPGWLRRFPVELAPVPSPEGLSLRGPFLSYRHQSWTTLAAGFGECRLWRYLCWLTESTFPSGSLNHATLSPLGVVQIPSSLSWTKGNFSKATPLF